MYTATEETWLVHANDYKVAPITTSLRFSRECADKIVDKEIAMKATKTDDVVKVSKAQPIYIIMLQRISLLQMPILYIRLLDI
jgi:hypothetical protein